MEEKTYKLNPKAAIVLWTIAFLLLGALGLLLYGVYFFGEGVQKNGESVISRESVEGYFYAAAGVWAILFLMMLVFFSLKILTVRCPKCLGRISVNAVKCRHCSSEFDSSFNNSWLSQTEHVMRNSLLLKERHRIGLPLVGGIACGLGILSAQFDWPIVSALLYGLSAIIFIGYLFVYWGLVLGIFSGFFVAPFIGRSIYDEYKLLEQRKPGEDVFYSDALLNVLKHGPPNWEASLELASFALMAVLVGNAAMYVWSAVSSAFVLPDNFWNDASVKDERPFKPSERTFVVQCFACRGHARVARGDESLVFCPHCEVPITRQMSDWLSQDPSYPNRLDHVFGWDYNIFRALLESLFRWLGTRLKRRT